MLTTNGPLTSPSPILYSTSACSPPVSTSLAKVSLSSFPSARSPRAFWEGGDRLSRVLAGFSVDHARREIGAIEQNLRPQQDGSRRLDGLGFWGGLRLIDRGRIEGFGGHRVRRGEGDEASGEGE